VWFITERLSLTKRAWGQYDAMGPRFNAMTKRRKESKRKEERVQRRAEEERSARAIKGNEKNWQGREEKNQRNVRTDFYVSMPSCYFSLFLVSRFYHASTDSMCGRIE
jgi:hypothetical protein